MGRTKFVRYNRINLYVVKWSFGTLKKRSLYPSFTPYSIMVATVCNKLQITRVRFEKLTNVASSVFYSIIWDLNASLSFKIKSKNYKLKRKKIDLTWKLWWNLWGGQNDKKFWQENSHFHHIGKMLLNKKQQIIVILIFLSWYFLHRISLCCY